MDVERAQTTRRAAACKQKALQERKRNAMVLMMRFLVNEGFSASYEALKLDTRLSLDEYDVADNVDLMGVIQEYEEYYRLRFDRAPKMIRKGSPRHKHASNCLRSEAALEGTLSGASSGANQHRSPVTAAHTLWTGVGQARQRRARAKADVKVCTGATMPTTSATRSPNAKTDPEQSVPDETDPSLSDGCDFLLEGHKPGQESGVEPQDVLEAGGPLPARALPQYLARENTGLSDSIRSTILTESPEVRWDSIAGLCEAKQLLQEAIVLPLQHPHLFTGLLAPWRGVLLYGPPGTGKTLLARAVATECRATFFNVSAAVLVSKWRGDSEKLVRALFDISRCYAPSVVFIDELDGLMMARGSEARTGVPLVAKRTRVFPERLLRILESECLSLQCALQGEHEASRRMKTEMLTQMDSLTCSNDPVFVLGATNLPWELDAALLRRLEKRIHVGLPCKAARLTMLQKLLAPRMCQHGDAALEEAASALEGRSGSDVHAYAREAAMRPVRRALASAHRYRKQDDVPLASISTSDLQAALEVVGQSGLGTDHKRYEEFTQRFAAGLSAV